MALDLIERNANFDYIAFVDSDDIVAPCFLETLVKKAEETSSDITVCGFFNFREEGGRREELVAPKKEDFGQEDFIEHVFARGSWTKSMGGGGMVWKALFSLNAVKGCRFPCDVRIVEDEVFCVSSAIRSKKFAYVPLALYGHRSRGGSLTCDQKITGERVKARLLSLEIGKSLPEYSQLVIASSLADAAVKAFQYSGNFSEAQLLPYKKLVLKAAQKGLVRKKRVRKFILFCNFPILSNAFFLLRNSLSSLKSLGLRKRNALNTFSEGQVH